MLVAALVAAAPADAKKPKKDKPPKGREAAELVAPGHGASEQIVLFDDDAVDGRRVDREVARRERSLGFVARLRYNAAVNGFTARLTPRQIERLEADPSVLMVAPDTEVVADGQEALATGEVAPPGIRRVGAATTTTAATPAGTNVAVLDTGIDLANADLSARHGVNCMSSTLQANDDNGHGTHVAGTIAARNAGTGVVGVAPATTLYAVKVLNAKETGTLSSIICGIDWVTRNAAALGIGVVNMSLSGSGKDDGNCGRTNNDPEHVAICNSVAAGVTYVVSAGNVGKPIATYIPAAYREVLTVTAMSDADGLPGAKGLMTTLCKTSEKDDRYASTSNYAATALDAAHVISAPGTCVASTKRGGGTLLMSGTSMAAPHVAGAVAQCRTAGAACDGLSPAATITTMRDLAAAAAPGNGFTGDPQTPITGKTYGWLVSARF